MARATDAYARVGRGSTGIGRERRDMNLGNESLDGGRVPAFRRNAHQRLKRVRPHFADALVIAKEVLRARRCNDSNNAKTRVIRRTDFADPCSVFMVILDEVAERLAVPAGAASFAFTALITQPICLAEVMLASARAAEMAASISASPAAAGETGPCSLMTAPARMAEADRVWAIHRARTRAFARCCQCDETGAMPQLRRGNFRRPVEAPTRRLTARPEAL